MREFRYLDASPSLSYDPKRCIGCAMCATVCPHAVFVMEEKKARLARREFCMECGACMQNCPAGAISVEAGEGCVRAVINELLGIEGPCC